MNLFILILLTCGFVYVDSMNDVLDAIVSFLTHDITPVSVLIPQLCWNPYAIRSLARALMHENINIARSVQTNRPEHRLQYLMIMADLSCNGTMDFLYNMSTEGYFKAPYRWLLLDLDDEDHHLEALEILVDSDVIIAKRSGRDVMFKEAYRFSGESSIIYNNRLLWRPLPLNNEENTLTSYNDKTELTSNINYESYKTTIERKKGESLMVSKYGIMADFRKTLVKSQRRKNLRGHVLTLALVITDSNDTRKHLDDRLQLHQDSISKNTYVMVRLCFDMLNATERVIFTHTWGYKDKHGNWQGLIDHLLKKEADLGTLTLFTQERVDIIDYIAMVGTTAVRFVFREPPLSYVSNIFALPFTGAVWLAILICVLGCSVFLYITSKWEASLERHHLQLDGSWADVLILVLGAVLQQGSTVEPRYAAGRCVTLLLFVALTILYAAYSANIVVLLRAPSSSVRTLQDLLNSPLKFGASDFEYNRYFFKKLNEPIRKAIYDKKIAPKGQKPNFYTMKEGVEKIRKGLFAFHMESNPGYRLIQETYREDEKCDLVEIDYINVIDPWVPGQKRSPFKDLFKINFLKIRESGLQKCVHSRLMVPRPRCSGVVSTFSSVGITDMYPAMLATLYGFLMAPVVLIIEIAYKKLITIRENRKILHEARTKSHY